MEYFIRYLSDTRKMVNTAGRGSSSPKNLVQLPVHMYRKNLIARRGCFTAFTASSVVDVAQPETVEGLAKCPLNTN
jgi:hypothetical protein